MGWGEIKRRCPRCKKLRRKVRDRRPDRQWRRMDGELVCHVCIAETKPSPERPE